MKIKIPNAEIQELLSGRKYNYPKYATQIMNLANQNAQGTRPRIVGQMSDLIQEFGNDTMENWESWYLSKYPNAIESATERIFNMVEELKKSIINIDKKLIRDWVEELVIIKTYSGLKFQEAILKKVSAQLNQGYRLANPMEESQGIDGFIGDQPVSIKPITYKTMTELPEHIGVPIIYYDKKKTEIVIESNL